MGVSKPFQGELRSTAQSKPFGSAVSSVSSHDSVSASSQAGLAPSFLTRGGFGAGHSLAVGGNTLGAGRIIGGGAGRFIGGGALGAGRLIGGGALGRGRLIGGGALISRPAIAVGGIGHGLAGHGLAGHGLVGHGLAGHGLVGHGVVGHGLAGHGLVGHGLVGRGLAGHGLVGHGVVGHGVVGHGVVGHGVAEVYPDEISPYTYQYNVADDYSGSNFQAGESDDGNSNRQGSYTVALPDGRVQHVNYQTNDLDGYIAEVTYDGQAAYPEAVRAVARPVIGGAALVSRPVLAGGALVGRPLIG